MIDEAVLSKWIEGTYPDTPGVLAAQTAVKVRLGAVEQLVESAGEKSAGEPEYAHQLRVTARRADAALNIFCLFFAFPKAKKTRKSLRKIRKAAARARNADVHCDLLNREAHKGSSEARRAIPSVLESLMKDREDGQKEIQRAAAGFRRSRVRRKLLRQLRIPSGPGQPTSSAQSVQTHGPYTLGALSACALPTNIQHFTQCFEADLTEVSSLHTLRIESKKLRYALEVFGCCLPREPLSLAYQNLVKMQTRLGRINDYFEISTRVSKLAKALRRQGDQEKSADSTQKRSRDMLALAAFFRGRFQRSQRRFVHWFDALRQRQVLDSVSAMLAPLPTYSGARGDGEAQKSGSSKNADVNRMVAAASDRHHRRVAAIDVGTNSIRMAVAETDPAVGFRIIEDVKETTRLGNGVFRTGKLKIGAVKRSLKALQRMRTIAEDYHVDALRAIGTSAIREATNGAEFVKLIRRQVGISIEVIRPQREARLAFSGVCRDFDLSDHHIAVVDIGGGSTELIFASRGVIDGIRPISLGAVRLTEIFERPDEPGRYYYGRMRRYVSKTLKQMIRRVPFHPNFIVGAGGTFTSLARVALRDASGKGGRFPFAVRGYELRLETVCNVLQSLRTMSLEERCRVPGLSVKRAEIIVAGLCIVEQLMRRVRVDRLLIHDGGVRDGLVAEMIDELGFHCEHPRTHPEQVLAAVARYADRMHFPREHSEHVARLALRIFDQLAALDPDAGGTWAKPAHRDLLHCAALLHDVGVRIAHKAHHKHAYDMVTHAQLATLTRREIEMIANVCLYHRKRGPKRSDPGFRKLGADDQRLMARLAGILRIADGFDCSQEQLVTDVFVKVRDAETLFEAVASRQPAAELRRANEKADLFESSFHTKVQCFFRASSRAPAMLEVASA